MVETVSGSCLCGGVQFEVELPFLRAGHCHCSRCRKHSGAFGCTQGRVPRAAFHMRRGGDLLVVYAPAPDAARKVFCRVCGSSVFGGTWPDGPEVSIRFGALDGDPGIRPQYHTFTADRACWDDVDDGLPRHPGALPRE